MVSSSARLFGPCGCSRLVLEHRYLPCRLPAHVPCWRGASLLPGHARSRRSPAAILPRRLSGLRRCVEDQRPVAQYTRAKDQCQVKGVIRCDWQRHERVQLPGRVHGRASALPCCWTGHQCLQVHQAVAFALVRPRTSSPSGLPIWITELDVSATDESVRADDQ
jgi:hypothetical protein